MPGELTPQVQGNVAASSAACQQLDQAGAAAVRETNFEEYVPFRSHHIQSLLKLPS